MFIIHPERFKIWNPKNRAKSKIWSNKKRTEIPVHTVLENHQSVTECTEWNNSTLERFYEALFWFTYKAKASEIQKRWFLFDFHVITWNGQRFTVNGPACLYCFFVHGTEPEKRRKKSDFKTLIFFHFLQVQKSCIFYHSGRMKH